ncbi:PaaI family thioesterase [Sphingomonas sp. CJ20]
MSLSLDRIPYAALLGLSIEPGEGAPVLLMPFADDVLGRPGFLHGGAIGGLLEMAAVAALHQALESEGGGKVKPINLTVDYMRGGRDKPTRARGTVTRLGKRVANVEAVAWQDEPDRPIAAARMNYLIVR